MAFGHSFLAMSGEESLAQVNRELEYPKHQNLMKAGMVIFVYSLLFTSLVSFFAYALIPDDVRPQYFNNLISGISIYLVGPMPLKLLFQGFIVIVGFLMLAGAINTSIIGSNGVLNRVSEDGVMTDWFRAPHRKYGTTYRMINLIVILQLVAIIGSRGNTYTLGEAYAFGVIWSFAFKGLAMLVLRFKDKSHREWKVPFNLHLGGTEIPLGLGVIAADPVLDRRHQPDHQAGGDGQRRGVHARLLHRLRRLGAHQRAQARRGRARRDGSVPPAAAGGHFERDRRGASGQLACASCATTTRWIT